MITSEPTTDIAIILARIQTAYTARMKAIQELPMHDLVTAAREAACIERIYNRAERQANMQLHPYGLRIRWRRNWMVPPYEYYLTTEPIPEE